VNKEEMNREDFNLILQQVVGLPTWSWYSPGWSYVKIDIGETIKVDYKTPKWWGPTTGKFSLILAHCSWRIARNGVPQNAAYLSHRDKSERSALNYLLSSLSGSKITSVSVNKAFDISVELDNSFRLDIFSDVVPDGGDHNYNIVFIDNTSKTGMNYIVCPDFIIQLEGGGFFE
jgi:hypothetical protein